MAETLNTSQLIANTYEPKRKYRWILELDGIDAFTCESAQRPTWEDNAVEIHYINDIRYVAGKRQWGTFDLVLKDPIAPSEAQKVVQWMRLVHDDPTARQGYAEMYKKDFSLKMLDGPGNVVEKWNILGAFPVSVDFGDLNYSDDEVATISVTLRPDKCMLEF